METISLSIDAVSTETSSLPPSETFTPLSEMETLSPFALETFKPLEDNETDALSSSAAILISESDEKIP